ncbi:MAG: small subunit ribosomal protein S18 [Planctomycetota bacterium]|jgi:small subunit ribosomal protein S18
MARRPRAVIASKSCDDPIINYKDTTYLGKFLTPQGQITSRRRTGFCSQCQRQLKKAIKQARHVALLPYVG